MSPDEALNQMRELLSMRKSNGITEQQLLIREPALPSCFLANLDLCLQAVKLIDVFSPNHLELAAFFGDTGPALDKATIEDIANR